MNLTPAPQPLLIGHQGYPAKFPENTLTSFEGGKPAGCDMIEVDATLTSNRHVVVIHNDSLNRTTRSGQFSFLDSS